MIRNERNLNNVPTREDGQKAKNVRNLHIKQPEA